MRSNTNSPLFMFLASLSLVEAHTRFTTLHINGKSQGDGVCIRQDQNPGTTTNFVPSITGPEMACGIDGTIANPTTCNANTGDQISLEHRMWPDGSQPGAIDVSHKGNTAIYMKKINSQSDEVTGNGWFKIYWDGYDTSTKEWGTDHMNANNGLVTTTIPSDLAPGNYLVRSEVLALQELGDPQMYVGCAQLNLAGTGSVVPADTTTIPGYIDMSTPAMTVNVYSDFTFTEYGPKLYGTGGSGNGTATSTSYKPSTTTSSSSSVSLSGTTSATTGATTGSYSETPNEVSAATTGSSTGDSPDSSGNSDSSNYDTTDGDDDGDDEDTGEDEGDDEEDDEGEYGRQRHRPGHNPSAAGNRWATWNNFAVRAARSVSALKQA